MYRDCPILVAILTCYPSLIIQYNVVDFQENDNIICSIIIDNQLILNMLKWLIAWLLIIDIYFWITLCCFCHSSWKIMPYQYHQGANRKYTLFQYLSFNQSFLCLLMLLFHESINGSISPPSASDTNQLYWLVLVVIPFFKHFLLLFIYLFFVF